MDYNEICKLLEDQGVRVSIEEVWHGPTVTRIDFSLMDEIRSSMFVEKANKILRNLGADHIRFVTPISDNRIWGVEINNKEPSIVNWNELINEDSCTDTSLTIPFAVGRDVYGNDIIADIEQAGNLLIAGNKGSGKTTFIRSLIAGLLCKSRELDLEIVLVGAENTDFDVFINTPQVRYCNTTNAARTFSDIINELGWRVDAIRESEARHIDKYNDLRSQRDGLQQLIPRVIVIVEELNELSEDAYKQFERLVCNYWTGIPAVGMHVIAVTSVPKSILPLVKANMFSRIAFRLDSQYDSRRVIDCCGADELLGRGDMLYFPIGKNFPQRVQSAFISNETVDEIVENCHTQNE